MDQDDTVVERAEATQSEMEKQLFLDLAAAARHSQNLVKKYEALLLENKKLKESLESESHYINELQKENAKLKSHMYDDSSHSSSSKKEVEIARQALAESHRHSGQLEKAIQYLRSKLEEEKTDRKILEKELLLCQEKVKQYETVYGLLSTSSTNSVKAYEPLLAVEEEGFTDLDGE